MPWIKAVTLEALLVIALGLAFAFAANGLSPRGLRLGQDYFPNPVTPPAAVPFHGSSDITAANPSAEDPSPSVIERLRRRGLRFATRNEAIQLFRDPRAKQGLVVFIDARDDRKYAAGHVPGAWLFDHYHAENYLPTVLPRCLAALKVVVYCTGGDCEDSEFAAIILRDAGVPDENLFVYTGGITDWTSHRLPVEIGSRGGG